MKRYLIYLAIISLGTLLFTKPAQASLSSNRAKTVSNIVTKLPSEPTTAAVAPVLTASSTAQAATTVSAQTALQTQAPTSTVPVQPIYPTDHVTLMQEAGISPSDYEYVDYIVSHESGWCSTKWEGQVGYCPSQVTDFFGLGLDADVTLKSKGFGECQSTPANKMATIASDYLTNPVTQLKWCNSYANSSRYGSWHAAYIHWINNGNW